MKNHRRRTTSVVSERTIAMFLPSEDRSSRIPNGEVHGDTTFPCLDGKLCNENFRYAPAFSHGDIESELWKMRRATKVCTRSIPGQPDLLVEVYCLSEFQHGQLCRYMKASGDPSDAKSENDCVNGRNNDWFHFSDLSLPGLWGYLGRVGSSLKAWRGSGIASVAKRKSTAMTE